MVVISLRKPSSHHKVEKIKAVNVYLHQDPNHYPSHSYGQVVATVYAYKCYNNPMLEPTFICREQRNLYTLILNGSGVRKAEIKTSKLLKRLGIECEQIIIHKEKKTIQEKSREPIWIQA